MDKEFRAQGGIPITSELAIELRQLIFGSAAVPIRCEWTTTPLNFSAPGEEHAYGLVSPRNATRGLLSTLQGFIIKHLLFKRSSFFGPESPSAAELLRPNEQQQMTALIASMVEILAQISESDNFFVTLFGEETFVPHSVNFFQDTVTEKFMAEDGAGALLFLYSAVLTRSIEKTRSDLDKQANGTVSLVGNTAEEGSINIVTLLLTGRATPYIHNGVVHAGDESNYAAPQYGILNRCSIGFLLWENVEKQKSTLQPGSRLKTPQLPIWITSCIGHFGVVFNHNPDLLRNYHAEKRFDLVYYTCSEIEVSMTIDNRVLNKVAKTNGKQLVMECGSSGPAILSEGKEESLNKPLQNLIHTKWEDACIIFHCPKTIVCNLFAN